MHVHATVFVERHSHKKSRRIEGVKGKVILEVGIAQCGNSERALRNAVARGDVRVRLGPERSEEANCELR